MRSGYNYVLRYRAEVTCVSPLRTGGAERDLEQVLRRPDGTPYLQGSSLSGAMRDWRENNTLFGSQDREGQLIVSDLEFCPDARQGARPRLRIDGVTGTGADRAKFDVTALLPGTRGVFTLVWQGDVPPEEAMPVLESYLAALHRGEIRLGAQKSNGFGQVRLSVLRRRYNLREQADRMAWLAALPGDQVDERDEKNEPVTLEEGAVGDTVTFRVTAKMRHLLIKASTPEGVGQDKIDAPHMAENGALLLPGSSIKGALRAHITEIAPFCLGPDWGRRLDGFFGRGSAKGQEGAGDNGIAGKARCSDGVFQDAKTCTLHRIRINRISGGVMRKALFAERPVTATVSWTITAPARETVGCALLLFALRDLGLGLFTLGSGSSIGHGRAERVHAEIDVPGRQLVTLDSQPGTVALEDPDGVTEGWLAACKEENP